MQNKRRPRQSDERVSSERMAKADKTLVQFLWIHLWCLCLQFVKKNATVQATYKALWEVVKYDQ